jgi:hypothetical protein
MKVKRKRRLYALVLVLAGRVFGFALRWKRDSKSGLAAQI